MLKRTCLVPHVTYAWMLSSVRSLICVLPRATVWRFVMVFVLTGLLAEGMKRFVSLNESTCHPIDAEMCYLFNFSVNLARNV